jgi:hypothetical protein
MKQSHYTTPRTLNECQFSFNSDPIERHEGSAGHTVANVMMVLAAIAVVAVLFGVL